MIKALFFDLDGTLYVSPVIRGLFAQAAVHTLSKYLRISTEEAESLIKEKREELEPQYGASVPYTLTLRQFGVPIEYWHEENVRFFNPREYLSDDKQLRESLVTMKGCYQLIVATNNNHTQAMRILEALNIADLFKEVFTYNSFGILKPDPEFYRRALDALHIKPDEGCMIGDRKNVDLEPAKLCGMETIEVTDPHDIYNLVSRLCKEE